MLESWGLTQPKPHPEPAVNATDSSISQISSINHIFSSESYTLKRWQPKLAVAAVSSWPLWLRQGPSAAADTTASPGYPLMVFWKGEPEQEGAGLGKGFLWRMQ